MSLIKAKLDLNDIQYLVDFIDSISDLVIEQKNVEDERKKTLEEKDKIDKENDDYNEVENDDDINESSLAEINRSIKSIEIIGQILRNRYGSLTRKQLYDLAESAYTVGLRFLKFHLTITDNIKDEILKVIKKIICENSSLSDDDVTKKARKIYMLICYGVSYALIQKIANSLGSKQLVPIFEELREKHPDSPAIQLIDIAIKLEFTNSIPKEEIKKLFIELKSNVITRRMLQEVVLQHLYLHNTDFRDKQWISNTLEIPIKTQRLIERQKSQKKLEK